MGMRHTWVPILAVPTAGIWQVEGTPGMSQFLVQPPSAYHPERRPPQLLLPLAA